MQHFLSTAMIGQPISIWAQDIQESTQIMHIFIPEIIYQKIKDTPKFVSIYKKFNDLADANSNCIVKYNNYIDNLHNYQDFADFMSSHLDQKDTKIWNCFCVDVEYDETTQPVNWLKSKKVIDDAKSDSDIDVMMYGYYKELANTADHESDVWIDNVDQSIKIWENYKDNILDPRLYIKYYWDKHEQFEFYLKLQKDKDILESFYKYDKMDNDIKNFLFSKHNTTYFKDIVNHKTIYTAILFWGSVNDVSLNDPDKTRKVMQLIDQKICSLDYKYSDFNMHLVEWLWINFKWWFDRDQPSKYIGVWNILLDVINQATTNKSRMIKALTHHNFNYTSRFLTFVSNLYEIENTIFQIHPSKILSMNWTDDEKSIITSNPELIKDMWRERIATADNYQKYMLQPIKNKLITRPGNRKIANK
jgi:hypothetical protein